MKHFSFAEHRLCRFEAQPKVDNPQVAETKVEALNISQKIETILKLNSECEKIVATIPSDSTNVRDQYAKRLEAAKQHCLAAQLQTSAESMAKLDSFIQELQGHKEVLQTWEMRKKGVVAEKSDQQLYANDPNGKLTSYTVEFTDGWTLEKWEPALPIRYKLYDTVIGTGKYGNTWGVHLQDGDSITVTARKGNETKSIVVNAEKPVTASPQSESNISKDAVVTTPAVEKKTPTPAAKEMPPAEKPVAEKAAPAEKVSTTQVDPLKNMDTPFQVAMNDTMKKIQEDPYIKGMEPSMPAETPGPSPIINTDSRKSVRDAQSTVTPDISRATQEALPVLSATPDLAPSFDTTAASDSISASMDDAPVTVADLTPKELAQQKAEKEEKDRKIHATKLPEYPFTPKQEKQDVEKPITPQQQELRRALDGTNQTIQDAMEALRAEDTIFDIAAIRRLIDASNEQLATLTKLDTTQLTIDGTLSGYLEACEKKYFRPGSIQRFYIGYDRPKNALYFGDTATDQAIPKPETAPAETLNGLIEKGEYAQAIKEFVEKPMNAKNFETALTASKQLREVISKAIQTSNKNETKELAIKAEEELDALDTKIADMMLNKKPQDPEL